MNEENKPENIQKVVNEKLAAQVAAMTKQYEEMMKKKEEMDKLQAALSDLEITEGDEQLVGIIKEAETSLSKINTEMNERVSKEKEAFLKKSKEIEDEYKEDISTHKTLIDETRKELVESIGETATSFVLGSSMPVKVTSTGTSTKRSGGLDGLTVKEYVGKIVIDEMNGKVDDWNDVALKIKERFPESEPWGSNEKIKGGKQKNGNLMKRHMMELVNKDGKVKVVEGVFSWV